MTETEPITQNPIVENEWIFMGSSEEKERYDQMLHEKHLQQFLEDWNRRWGKYPRSKRWIRKAGRLVHNAQGKCDRGLLSQEEIKKVDRFKELYAAVLFSVPRERMRMLNGGKKLYGQDFVDWIMKRHLALTPRYSHAELREREWEDDFSP